MSQMDPGSSEPPARPNPSLLAGIPEPVLLACAAFIAVLLCASRAVPPLLGLAILAVFLLAGRARYGWQPRFWLLPLAASVPLSMKIAERFNWPLGLDLGDVLFVCAAYAAWRTHGWEPLRRWTRGLTGILLTAFLALSAVALLRVALFYEGWFALESIAEYKPWLGAMLLLPLGAWAVSVSSEGRATSDGDGPDESSRESRVTSHEPLLSVLALIALAGAASALLAVFEYHTGGGGSFDSSRVDVLTGEPNHLASFLLAILFYYSAWFLARWKSRSGWAALPLVALGLRAVMVTFSRGGYVGALAGAMAQAWARSKGLFLAGVAALLIVAAFPQLLPAGIRYRMNMTVKESWQAVLASENPEAVLETSSAYRIMIWKGALRMIADKPLLGVGFGAFDVFIPHYTYGKVEYFNPHNYYLQIAAEMGAPALGVFLALALVLAWRISRLTGGEDAPLPERVAALGWIGGFFAVSAASLFGPELAHPVVAPYVWLMAGMLDARACRLREEAEA